MKFAGTGHRPDKLGGYSDEAFNVLVEIAEKVLGQLETLGPKTIISGMALGWDMALAQAAINRGDILLCAIPFKGQELKWPKQSQDKYNSLMAKANEVVVVCEGGYSPEKMQIRNQWMVDNCDIVLAMHDGSTGGTNNCVKYAKSINKRMLNLYGTYLKKTNNEEK